MGTRMNPGKFDCYANAKDKEQMFTILGRDPSGPSTLLFWCLQRAKLIRDGIKEWSDIEMIEEAYVCAQKMTEERGKISVETMQLFKQVQEILANLKSHKQIIDAGAY